MKQALPSNSSRISVETDGAKDSVVHCIKSGSMAADAAAVISAETATLLCEINQDDVDSDPFASYEEFENDETIVDDE